MIKRYTFLRHPFYYVLENSRQMVNGLEKCIGVFYDDNSRKIEVLSFNNSLEHLEYDGSEFLKKLRDSKKQANWIKKTHVPFEVGKPIIEQLSFIDEEQSSVLELHFKNASDEKYDILYLYFKSNIGNFKLSNSDEAMAVDVKGVIQTLLYNQIQLLIYSNKNDAEIHKTISPTLNQSALQQKINQLEKDRIDLARSNYLYILRNLTLTEPVEYGLSNAAIKQLSEHQLDLGQIEKILARSVEIIVNKYNPVGFYELSELDLIIDNHTVAPTLSIQQENLNNTRLFLDKYESAAKLLNSKNEKITGLNIGANCHPKVSPAAISDILKKHQNKIILLLQQHPDKWPTIKNKFKPIVNIYVRSSSQQAKFGA